MGYFHQMVDQLIVFCYKLYLPSLYTKRLSLSLSSRRKPYLYHINQHATRLIDLYVLQKMAGTVYIRFSEDFWVDNVLVLVIVLFAYSTGRGPHKVDVHFA